MVFDRVIKRLQTYKRLKFEYEVASTLGLSKFSLSERKARASLPKKELNIFCEREMVNESWLMTGKGWTFSPGTSGRAFDWIQKMIVEHEVRRVIVIKYTDKLGEARGFLIETSNGYFSMEGSGTKAGYIGAGPNFYRSCLEELHNAGIDIEKVRIAEKHMPSWEKIDVAEFVLGQKIEKMNVRNEIVELRPDLFPKEFERLKAGGVIEKRDDGESYDEVNRDAQEINKLVRKMTPERRKKFMDLVRFFMQDK